jgi:hypothetical protein
MPKEKKVGVYLDHANAHLVEYIDGTNESKIVGSKFTHEEKEQSLSKSEKLMHNKEDHEQSEYYKTIARSARDYNFVLLFGPTEAKAELHNILNADHHFSEIRIEVRPSDKMTEPQIHTFVREYFSNH